MIKLIWVSQFNEYFTFAPFFSSSSQNALPRPVAPPVTIATFPFTSIFTCDESEMNEYTLQAKRTESG